VCGLAVVHVSERVRLEVTRIDSVSNGWMHATFNLRFTDGWGGILA
jgi:hypothetical protein